MARWIIAAVVIAAGCGSSKPPTYQLTQSKAAVRGAVEVGARDVPKAALHLKLARDATRSAEELILQHEYARARHLLRAAEADANLAIALANEAKAKQEAEEMKRKLTKLRAEADR